MARRTPQGVERARPDAASPETIHAAPPSAPAGPPALLATISDAAREAPYPDRPLRYVVPFHAGALNDLLARQAPPARRYQG